MGSGSVRNRKGSSRARIETDQQPGGTRGPADERAAGVQRRWCDGGMVQYFVPILELSGVGEPLEARESSLCPAHQSQQAPQSGRSANR